MTSRQVMESYKATILMNDADNAGEAVGSSDAEAKQDVAWNFFKVDLDSQ